MSGPGTLISLRFVICLFVTGLPLQIPKRIKLCSTGRSDSSH